MLSTRRLVVLGLVSGVLGIIGLAHAAGRAKGPLLHLLPPENVTASTRAELQGRMTRHGNTMTSLVRGVVLLDRPTITTMAQRIADEELLARGDSPPPDPWRPLLPKGFFLEQDALRSSARELARAAATGEPDAVLADRLAELTKTCVRCHSAYVHDLPSGASPR